MNEIFRKNGPERRRNCGWVVGPDDPTVAASEAENSGYIVGPIITDYSRTATGLGKPLKMYSAQSPAWNWD